MRKLKGRTFLAALILLAVTAGLIYQLPPVNSRLSWRFDFAKTYLRTLIQPIKPLPTALPAPEVAQAAVPTLLPTSTKGPVPTQTRTATTPIPELSPAPLPERVELTAPAWEKQDINNCGPAALAMYLRFFGWEGDQETITQVIKPFREDRNVNVEELAYYVRTQAGWLQVEYRVGGDLETLKRILAAGIPVMIEESFFFEEPYWSGDDLWAAHYQLLTGYDDSAQTFTGQDSFYGPDQKINYQKQDEYWQAFNRVYIMIFPPEKEAELKALIGEDWESDRNRERALDTAQNETEADPSNPYAWFNLGTNLTYFERYIEATDAFDQARELGLPQRMLRYQFSPFIAYFHSGQIDDLITLTEYALEVTPNAEEALLWHGWALYRQGKKTEAVENFQQALVENPNYHDAQYALDFVANN